MKRWRFLAAFNGTHICSVDFASERELFLRYSNLVSQFGDSFSKEFVFSCFISIHDDFSFCKFSCLFAFAQPPIGGIWRMNMLAFGMFENFFFKR